MADIFISYSRKDSTQALELAEKLRAEGMSVWIDQHGIEAATQWSTEIVSAIEGCTAFLLLLSENSLKSENVVKELSLASEYGRSILPVEISRQELPRSFKYQLAGIQRAPLADVDGIVRSLAKLGVTGSEAGKPSHRNPGAVSAPTIESKLRLAVLPFDDLSPAKDNEWFADGMMDELISTLGSLEKLHVNPKTDVLYYKKNKPKLDEIAADLKCRYIVEGGVQKSGEKIRIRVSLSDAVQHKQLWSQKYDGTFVDIFDFQDRTARAIAESLRITLSPEEEKLARKKLTDNAEAYELYLRGLEYFHRQTKCDFERALALYEDAVRLDPRFAAAHSEIANACQSLYRSYSRTPELLDKADAAAGKVREIEGETARYFWIASHIALQRGSAETALLLAQRSVEVDPNFGLGFGALLFAHRALGNLEEAARAQEQDVRLKENNPTAHFNLIIALHEIGDRDRLYRAAERAIPFHERHVRLNPDDYNSRVNFATVLQFARRESEALAVADALVPIDALDGRALYDLACFYLRRGAHDCGLELFRRSIANGFRNLEGIRMDPDLDPLRDRKEFQELIRQLEQKRTG